MQCSKLFHTLMIHELPTIQVSITKRDEVMNTKKCSRLTSTAENTYVSTLTNSFVNSSVQIHSRILPENKNNKPLKH